MSTLETVARSEERRFLGHPWPLATLFGMEVWERFSFYGMQAILLIYLYHSTAQGGLGISQSVAIGVVGAYGSGVYLAAILGGWFADRVLGAERTLFYSGVIVMLGHIALAILPGIQGVTAGMVLVAIGSGGVKSTCSSLVGSLYPDSVKPAPTLPLSPPASIFLTADSVSTAERIPGRTNHGDADRREQPI
uniref:oligopeptide:H+ symporter n=1 Tax=Halomonas sp. TaxID=1486246 RepID=UPI00263451B7